MASKSYTKLALTGGAAGSLDSIDGDLLADGDRALVVTASASYMYRLSAGSGVAESSPAVISPDTNAGTKRWLLIDPYLCRNLWTDASGYITANNNTELKIADTDSTTLPVIKIDKAGEGAAAAPMAMWIDCERTEGVSTSCVRFDYRVKAASTTWDVGLSSIALADDLDTGGAIWGSWSIASGPKTDTGDWIIVGAELNCFNRYDGTIYQTDRSGKCSIGLLIAPESAMWIADEDGEVQGYDGNYAIWIGGSQQIGYDATHWQIPIMIDATATHPGGTSIYIAGGTSSSDDPGEALRLIGHFGVGLNFQSCTFNTGSAAILLDTAHQIQFYNSSIYHDSGALNFYVPAGTDMKFNLLGAGCNFNILGLPTSASGLSSGDVWNDSGTLKIA